MSALDDIIARDGAQPAAPSALDAIIARDAQGGSDGIVRSNEMGPSIDIGALGPAPAEASPVAPISLMGRVGQGAQDTVNAGAQLLTHSLPSRLVDSVNSATSSVNNLPVIGPITKALGMVPATSGQIDQSIAKQEKDYAAGRAAAGSTGFDAARMTGNLLSTAPLAMLAPAGAGIATGAALGAANGALSPVITDPEKSFGEQKATQVGLGALTGGVAAPAANLVGKTISGFGGAAQRKLADLGVNMTPGQIMGGALAKTEDKLTSVPVLGDFIKNAQQRSIQDFNKATYNQVLEPLGQKYSGPVGQDGVAAVQRTISDAYDSALSKLHLNANDPHFQTEITKLGGLAQNLPDAQAKTFTNVLKTQIFGKLGPQGTMDGQTLKGVQSELSRTARGYQGDPSFDNRQLGQAIAQIKDAVDSSLSRTNAAEPVKELANANAAYANFVRLRGAAGSAGAGNKEGIFTPAQLATAVRGADKSAGKGAYATGNALMQDLSSAGQSVLGSKYPDSGTAGRSMMAMAGPAVLGHMFLPPELMAVAGAGLGMGSAPYTQMGQKLAQAMLMSRPSGAQPVGQAIGRYGSAVAPLLGTALVNGADR